MPLQSYRSDWDMDEHGRMCLTHIGNFQVATLEKDGKVIVRLESIPAPGEPVAVAQTALTASAALSLAQGLQHAAEKIMVATGRHTDHTRSHVGQQRSLWA